MNRKTKDKRILNIKSIHNLRTLGGLTNSADQIIGHNKLFRSAALDQVTKEDARILKDRLGIDTVIDLRTIAEVEKKPDIVMEGISYIHMPVFVDAIPGVSREAEPGNPNIKADMLPDLRDMYANLIADQDCINHFSQILKKILNHRGGAILWHCTAGKDRCGMVSMFIEHILGIDQDTIRQDYLLTNLDSKKTARKYYLLLFLLKRDPETAKKVYEAYIAHEDYLNSALRTIDESFGGMDSFIENQLGIKREEIAAFREYILS